MFGFAKEKTKKVKMAEIHGSLFILSNKKALSGEEYNLLWIEDNGLQVTVKDKTILIPISGVACVEFE